MSLPSLLNRQPPAPAAQTHFNLVFLTEATGELKAEQAAVALAKEQKRTGEDDGWRQVW